MTTATDARNALINSLNAILSLQVSQAGGTPTQTQAQTTALLTLALTQLEGSATLDTTIVATVNAAITNFQTASTANGTSLATATAAVNTATAALNTAAASVTSPITALSSRQGFTIGMNLTKTALPIVDLYNEQTTGPWNTYAYLMTCVPPMIYDKRDNKTKFALQRPYQGIGSSAGSPYTDIFTMTSGVITNVKSAIAYSGNTQPFDNVLMLPLANTPTDATTKVSVISMNNWLCNSAPAYPYVCNNFYIWNESNWATALTIGSQTGGLGNADHIGSPGFIAYDKTNKTMVFLAYVAASNTSNGYPDATAPVKELFANGVVRAVTGSPTGPIGWYNYTNSSRFVILSGNTGAANAASYPTEVASILNNENFNSSGVTGYFNSNPTLNTSSSQTKRGPAGQYMFPAAYGNINHDFTTGNSNFNRWNNSAQGGLTWRTPMWVVNADGSVVLHQINYSPDFTWRTGATVTSYMAIHVKGYWFTVVDDAGVVQRSGYVNKAEPIDLQGEQQYLSAGALTSLFVPIAYNYNDDTLVTMIGQKGQAYTTSSTQSFTYTAPLWLETHQLTR
jgi:hypothetical protein